jgi:hypothetical protein
VRVPDLRTWRQGPPGARRGHLVAASTIPVPVGLVEPGAATVLPVGFLAYAGPPGCVRALRADGDGRDRGHNFRSPTGVAR